MSMSSVMSMSNQPYQPYQPLEKVEPNPLAVLEKGRSEDECLEEVEPTPMPLENEFLLEKGRSEKVESKDLAPPFPKVVKVVKVVKEAVEKLSKKYNFEVEEALLYLSQPLKNQPLKKVEPKVKSESLKKVEKLKAKYPMPFDGVKREECCNGVVKNHGLYTQCSKKVKNVECEEGESSFGSTFSKGGGLCKGCEGQPYGNIDDRVKVGLYEYKDPKGKSPKRYTEVLKTLKVSKEEVEEEAKRLNIVIAPEHLEEVVVENVKRGRPKAEKKVKEATGKKGRPKKENKKVEVNDDEEEDLFATLIANVCPPLGKVEPNHQPLEKVEPNPIMPLENEVLEKVDPNWEKDVIVEEAKDLAPPLAKVDKVEKKAKKVDPVKEGEKQKKAEEKAAKDAAKEAEKQKKAEEKAAKEAEKQKKAEEKAAKEAIKESKKKSKDLAPPLPKVDKEEEADVVNKLEFEGNSYYKSKKSGVIYNMEHEVVGKWNEERKGIDFEEEEEEEEEYDD